MLGIKRILPFIMSLMVGYSTQVRGGDFNADGTAEAAVFRPASGLWAARGVTRFYFGAAGDFSICGDFDGNGTDEGAVYRPSRGLWAVRGVTRFYFGSGNDTPVAGDFNGDGTVQAGIYRSVVGLWAIRNYSRLYFGGGGDVPVPGDYDGDGLDDPGVFRGRTGLWAIRSVTRVYFGSASDEPVPADYNGDGRCDFGLFAHRSGRWSVKDITRRYFGSPGDIPQPFAPGNSAPARAGIFRPAVGLWALSGITRAYFGGPGDFPLHSPRRWLVRGLPAFGVELMPGHRDEVHLDRLAESGAEATRINHISWAAIEPINTAVDNYNWESPDLILSRYGERNLSTIVTFSSIPSWAGATCSGPFDNEALDDFVEFIGAVVNRYSRPPYNVKYWELFNEPDGTIRLPGPGAASSWGYHGREYARMLEAVYPVVKASDPASRLVMGGLAHDSFIDSDRAQAAAANRYFPREGIFCRGFFQDVLESGGGDHFDIMNYHYYYFACESWGNIAGKADHLRELMSRYGVARPMICSEVGIWGYEEEGCLALQARYLPKVFVRGLAAGLENVIWYPLSSRQGWSFEGGLLREEDLSAKPAYVSFRTLVNELKGYRYAGVVETAAPDIEGFEFAARGCGKTKRVIWSAEGASGYAAFPYSSIRVAAIDGTAEYITDDGPGDLDGKKDGRIVIGVDPSPVYVENWRDGAGRASGGRLIPDYQCHPGDPPGE